MVSLVDIKRFKEFLDGESLRLAMINPQNYRAEERGTVTREDAVVEARRILKEVEEEK